jgi:hypothetical protein
MAATQRVWFVVTTSGGSPVLVDVSCIQAMSSVTNSECVIHLSGGARMSLMASYYDLLLPVLDPNNTRVTLAP